MRLTPETLEFIHAPDTVDFVTRATDAFFDYAHSSDDIVIGQMLSGRYVLGYVKEENFHKLEEALGAAFVSSVSVVLGLLDRPALEAAGVSQVHRQPYLNLKGRGVLLGFLDTGINYTQDVFRYEDGTSKIRYIYDQTAEGSPPDGFLLGREYSKEDIDAALASEDPYALVPERDENGHGTFMASVAAGKETEDFSGAAPDAEIIAVKLKKARPFYREKYCVPKEQEDAYESSAVMLGVEYILQKARELGRPVAICIGLGTNAGSHDGVGVFEEYLGGVSIQKGVCLCAAAGNEAEARHHTGGVLEPGEKPGQIDLKVGDAAGDVYLAIWNTVADRLSISVRSPTGELVGRVPARPGSAPAADVKLVLETARVQIEFPCGGQRGTAFDYPYPERHAGGMGHSASWGRAAERAVSGMASHHGLCAAGCGIFVRRAGWDHHQPRVRCRGYLLRGLRQRGEEPLCQKLPGARLGWTDSSGPGRARGRHPGDLSSRPRPDERNQCSGGSGGGNLRAAAAMGRPGRK